VSAAGVRAALAALGLAVAALTVVLARSVPSPPIDYAHIVVYIGISWSFIGAGLVAWRRRPDNPLGLLLVAAGLIRFSSQIGWWASGFAALVDGLGRNFFLAVLAHVIVVFPTGRLRARRERAIVATAYALAVLGYVVPNAFDDGWEPNMLLVQANSTAVTVLGALFDSAAIAIALLLATIVIGRWRMGSRPARRALAPLLWTAPVAAVATAAALAHDELGISFSKPVDIALGWGAVTQAAIPLALLVGLVRSRLHRSVIADLLLRLERSSDPGSVRQALAETLGDPSLELAFPLADGDVWVDERGNRVDVPKPDEARAVTTLSENGRTVAVLIYDPFLLEEAELVAGAATAARLTLANTRLQAELRAQLAEVRASRARIVDAGDNERRRLERNLHDGAQQRLLGIRLALSLARGQAGDAAQVAGLLAEAEEELQDALEELRALARGIHPALLTDEGLGAALASLARRAAVPVEVVAPPGRLPTAIEQAAYYVASEALANVAKHARASHAAVTLKTSNGTLVVEVVDDGSGGADANGAGLRGLRDRVEALDGRLELSSPLGHGTRLCVELPCA
jgi:signal transduction histidine kinase